MPDSSPTTHPELIVGADGLARPVWAAHDPLLREYYDNEWGQPIYGESELFERISLEGFQAGLSWATILRKRPAFRDAFANFDPDIVAEFGESEVASLMNNAGIVRNRAKIKATIANAQATISLRDSGGLSALVWSFLPEQTPVPYSVQDVPTQSPQSRQLSQALKAAGFSFVGPTTMFALMEAIGMVDTHLVGSHRRGASGIWETPNP